MIEYRIAIYPEVGEKRKKEGGGSVDEMKFNKKSVAADARMDVTPDRANWRATSFKRSKSFRASSRFISKIRSQTNVRGRAAGVDVESSGRQPDPVARSKSTNVKVIEDADFMEKLRRDNGTKETTDIRGIVKDVKNKLSITMRARRKKGGSENPTWLDGRPTSNGLEDRLDSANAQRDRAFSTTMNEFNSYENPTFDHSFDDSISGCLYKSHPDPCRRDEDRGEIGNDATTRNDAAEKMVTILVGNDQGPAARPEPPNERYEESHTFQGMEFLEGFGKKKQHQASNNLPSNINPLTAQASLNIHVHALFSAVEHGHLDKARTILESTDVDVNSVNSDGLSALDVAVLGSNRSLAKMLVAFGAQEGNRFTSPESLGSNLAALLSTAEQRVQELGGTTSGNSIIETASCRNDFTTPHNSLARCADTTDEKQLALWERRVRALRKMLLGFDQARPPDIPLSAMLDVTGTTSVVLKFQESEIHDSSICTKIKVQWSTDEDFANICGERLVMDMKQRECRVDRLAQGQRYHFRVAAGNIKGWSRFVHSTPAYVTPSSWQDLEGKSPRYLDRLEQLESLFASIRRPEYSNETPALQRRNQKKKTTTIKQLFSATSKFQKSLRRGIFLACLLYHEDKILVTSEDFLPVIEIDETYTPSCLYNDFHWFMKVSCTWDDVKSLRQDMEKCSGSSSNHTRMKLLQASSQMQAALSIQDLGQIYHKPLKDAQGTIVISIVNCVKNPKSISLLNSRWIPLNKVIKKTISQENNNVADILMSSIQSQMTYHQLSSIKLTKGLYLGYLKMQSNVDNVQVFVPSKAPNVLPHSKIRDNPHVSAEEWEYLKKITRIPSSDLSQNKIEEKENATNEGTEQQKLFVELVSATSRRLFSYMNISSEESENHRLYDSEVIELTNQVSLIVIVPPADNACSVPGTRETLLQREDLLLLPIQVFEMLHLATYQKNLLNLYSRLSCILELDTALAQQNHREAFSSSEVSVAKERLTKLQDLQSQTNTVWKRARWLIDLITFARDRGGGPTGHLAIPPTGISMKYLLGIEVSRSKSNQANGSNNNNNGNNLSNGHSLKRSSVQLPPRDPKLVKSSPGRGSWPGLNLSSNSVISSNLLSTELSKSEQQLPHDGATGQYTRKGSYDGTNFSNDPPSSRFNSNSENLESNSLSPIVKSEDTILLTKYKHSPRNRLVNSLTLVSGNTTTSSNINNFGRGVLALASSASNITTTVSLKNNDDYNYANANIALGKTKSVKPTASVAAVATPSIDSQIDRKKDDATVMPAPLPGILQVYAAYETGLASGTSLKLHVTPRTTAREVVDLVVKQLNMAVVLKGQEGPIYTSDELPNFCLVAVIGARERCLRDDFKPLQLQNPWKKGRLYVRQKQDVLAALEHSSKHTAYL
ncbi:uncharacterized protein wake isoform X2 [Venturia canescens]|uniref:uncharacterized protein wake isoform X2 n=1 Tax=Venturia canescens TaxID=32260 RepID=UPI001C9D4652|nr:uncharacterized protein LOC122414151 isoform X2 [Venturia canescens]